MSRGRAAGRARADPAAGGGPVAAYVPAVRTGAYVYVSGQLPVADGKLPATGKVGDAVSAQDAAGWPAPAR